MIILKQKSSARDFLPQQAPWAVLWLEEMSISAHHHPLELQTLGTFDGRHTSYPWETDSQRTQASEQTLRISASETGFVLEIETVAGLIMSVVHRMLKGGHIQLLQNEIVEFYFNLFLKLCVKFTLLPKEYAVKFWFYSVLEMRKDKNRRVFSFCEH